MTFFNSYRNEGFVSSMNIAKSVALDMGVEPTFPLKRRVIRKNNLMKGIMKKKLNQLKSILRLTIFWLLWI